MTKLNAQQLRRSEPLPEMKKKLKRNQIYIVLDNVLDTYNVGSIFRLADAVSAKKIFLCGRTETPPNPRIKKASVSTWRWVEWEHTETAVSAISNINPPAGGQKTRTKIIVIEQHPRSISLSKLKVDFPVAVVVGNETYGVSKGALKLADMIVELPMFGVNKSLNVMVSCGIVLYRLIEFL